MSVSGDCFGESNIRMCRGKEHGPLTEHQGESNMRHGGEPEEKKHEMLGNPGEWDEGPYEEPG